MIIHGFAPLAGHLIKIRNQNGDIACHICSQTDISLHPLNDINTGAKGATVFDVNYVHCILAQLK